MGPNYKYNSVILSSIRQNIYLTIGQFLNRVFRHTALNMFQSIYEYNNYSSSSSTAAVHFGVLQVAKLSRNVPINYTVSVLSQFINARGYKADEHSPASSIGLYTKLVK